MSVGGGEQEIARLNSTFERCCGTASHLGGSGRAANGRTRGTQICGANGRSSKSGALRRPTRPPVHLACKSRQPSCGAANIFHHKLSMRTLVATVVPARFRQSFPSIHSTRLVLLEGAEAQEMAARCSPYLPVLGHCYALQHAVQSFLFITAIAY